MKRVLSRMLLASGLMLGASVLTTTLAAEAAPDAAKGGQLYDQGDASRNIPACASCHGAAGNSTMPANPSLSSQPHEYLAKELHDFKLAPGQKAPARAGADGAPTIMTSNVANLTDQDIANVALYLAEQPVKDMATAGHKDLDALGEKIWRGGIAERGVPACAACHGATGLGIPGQYPRLQGQFPSYIQEQLTLFQSKDRDNSVPMNAIADRMSAQDIKAVADYAAGLR